MRWMMQLRGKLILLCLIVFAALSMGLIQLLRSAREAARAMGCSNNLKSVGLALMNYEGVFKSLPLAIESAPDGSPYRSWRSQLYPTYMEQMAPIYDATAAWDSPANLKLINGTPIPRPRSKGGEGVSMAPMPRVPEWFACPSCVGKTHEGSNYVVVIGEETAFPRTRSTRISDITDGIENTVVVVESIDCMPEWTEPRDLDFNTMSFEINSKKGPSISSSHSDGALVCFADNEVYRILPSISEKELKALLTIAGGEEVTRAELLKRGVLKQN